MKKIAQLTLVCITFGHSCAFANWGDFQLNGFLSTAVAWSNVDYLPSGVEPLYVSEILKKPSFDKDTNIGIQITKYLREDVSITTQLYAEAANRFDVEATWAFIKWEPNDHWQLRAGRVRNNAYMLSEYVNVGYAYPWVRPPQEVYSQIPFNNFTGVDARYKLTLWHRDLSISAFYGSETTDIPISTTINPTLFDMLDMRLRNLSSLNIRYGDEVFSVRAAALASRLTLYPDGGTLMRGLNDFLNGLVNGGLLGGDYTDYFSASNVSASFIGMGYQLDWKNVVSMGEVVKRQVATPVIADAIGWYVMGGYRVKQFLPHITFGRERVEGNSTRRFPGLVNAAFMAPAPFGAGSPVSLDSVAQSIIGTSPSYEGGVGDQSSVTIGLRWDIYEGIAIKGEYCHVHPDRNSGGLFDVNPGKSVNIYSFAVDAVM